MKYKTVEDFEEYLDLLVDDVTDIQNGFEMCRNMHKPVRVHAQKQVDKGQICLQEIRKMRKDIED